MITDKQRHPESHREKLTIYRCLMYTPGGVGGLDAHMNIDVDPRLAGGTRA